MSDEDLLKEYLNSENTAYFGELFQRYAPLLYGVSLKYLRDADRAHDAVMQLFEDLLPKIGQYDIKVFRTWLYSVVKNHCLQLLRKENKEINMDFSLVVMESDPVVHLLCEEEGDTERIEVMHRCIEKLPDPQRVSILHFFIDEMSYADIVDKTGFHLKSVKSYIQNGKRNLKNCIEKDSDV